MSSLVRPTWAPYVAMWRVEELLRKVTDALNAAAIPYAVVGGNAVAEWVSTVDQDAVRATKDVDILLRRDSIPGATQTLTCLDMVPAEVMGVLMFLERDNPSPRRGVHVVVAGEKIRPQYTHAAPDVATAVRSQSGFMVIDLASLIAMKLQSFWPIDQAHIIDMQQVGLISDDIRRSLPADLLPKLDDLLRDAGKF